jgi:hypothetical protein
MKDKRATKIAFTDEEMAAIKKGPLKATAGRGVSTWIRQITREALLKGGWLKAK